MSLYAEPVQTLAPRSTKAPKLLFQDMTWDVDNWAPIRPGWMPYVCEHGGRFRRADGTEDSYMEGGYDKKEWRHIIKEKLVYALSKYPTGCLVVYDSENRKLDINIYPDDVVEDEIRNFRSYFAIARPEFPNLRHAMYSEFPTRTYWAYAWYEIGMQGFKKVQSGKDVTDDDRWAASKVASWRDGKLVLDNSAAYTAPYLAMRRANDRLKYGRTSTGKTNNSGGLDDVQDVSCPSFYDFYAGNDQERVLRGFAKELRRVTPQKQVYPFLWGRYHESAAPEIAGKPIPLDEWRETCRVTFELFDGACEWNTGDLPDHLAVLQEEAEKASR